MATQASFDRSADALPTSWQRLLALLTLRTGVFARWIGIVALVGALCSLVTFLALIQGTSEDSVLGYGFLAGVLAPVIWSVATSLAAYRAMATTVR